MSSTEQRVESQRDDGERFDVIVVGAGFAGMYLLHRLRGMGLTARVYEAGDSVGGTWYWNRYPGRALRRRKSRVFVLVLARTRERVELVGAIRDATGDPALRGIRGGQIRSEARHPFRASRHDARVTTTQRHSWTVETDRGDRAVAPFCVMATGCLSVPQEPQIAGLERIRRQPLLGEPVAASSR